MDRPWLTEALVSLAASLNLSYCSNSALFYSNNSKWRHMQSERPHRAFTERVLWPKPSRRTQKLPPHTDRTEHVLWPSLIHTLSLNAINLNPAVSVNKAQPTDSAASPAYQASVQGSGAFKRGSETANTGAQRAVPLRGFRKTPCSVKTAASFIFKK